MSEPITQSLCDKKLLSGPEPPVLLGEKLENVVQGCTLNNFEVEMSS